MRAVPQLTTNPHAPTLLPSNDMKVYPATVRYIAVITTIRLFMMIADLINR